MRIYIDVLRQHDQFLVMFCLMCKHYCRLLYWPGQIMVYHACTLKYNLSVSNIISFSVGTLHTRRSLRHSKTLGMSVRYGNKPRNILQTKCESCTQHNLFVSWKSSVFVLLKVWWGKHEACIAMDGQSRDSRKCCYSWHWHWKWSFFGGNGMSN